MRALDNVSDSPVGNFLGPTQGLVSPFLFRCGVSAAHGWRALHGVALWGPGEALRYSRTA